MKPCPYCGGAEIELLQFDEDGEYAAMFCQRKNCSASGPVVDVVDDGHGEYHEGETRKKALKAWNRRAALRKLEAP